MQALSYARCLHCGSRVRTGTLGRHQKRSVCCRVRQVFSELKSLGYEVLQIEDSLWPRFCVVPPQDPKPYLQTVFYEWWRRVPDIRPPVGRYWLACEQHVPTWVHELHALEPLGQGPRGLPRVFRGAIWIWRGWQNRLRVTYGIWVHREFHATLRKAIERALAERIVQGGGLIHYRRQIRDRVRRYSDHGWFAYAVAEVLEQAFTHGYDACSLVAQYAEGDRLELSQVPDQPHDKLVACPYCTKKVTPRWLPRHQETVFCRRARYRKQGMVCLWRVCDVTGAETIVYQLTQGSREVGALAAALPRYEIRPRRFFPTCGWEVWVSPEHADLLLSLWDAAVRYAAAGASPCGGQEAVVAHMGIQGRRSYSLQQAQAAGPVFAQMPFELVVLGAAAMRESRWWEAEAGGGGAGCGCT